jgi:hypothetical protein
MLKQREISVGARKNRENVRNALMAFEPQASAERLTLQKSGENEHMNNSSFYAADRVTHLKIVAVSLVASIVFLVVAIAARTSLETGYMANGPAMKAGQPMAVTRGDITVIR